MKRSLHTLLLSGYMLGPWVAACSQIHTTPPRTYYITQPAHTRQDSLVSPVVVFIEDRTLMWMNGVTLRSRLVRHEEGGCAHLAKKVGDSAFFVDSIMPPRGNVILTTNSATFECHPDEAPVHWHPTIADNMCELSGTDRSQDNALFPFNMMMCGLGIDSVIAYTVKLAPAVAGRK